MEMFELRVLVCCRSSGGHYRLDQRQEVGCGVVDQAFGRELLHWRGAAATPLIEIMAFRFRAVVAKLVGS